MKEQLRKNLWFAYLTALATWMILSYGYFAEEARHDRLFAFYDEGRPHISDFINAYNAGVLAKRCQSERLTIYDPDVQAKSQAKLTAPVVAEQPFYCQLPPFFFLLMRPLAEVSLLQAWVLWFGIGTILYVMAIKSLVWPVLPGKFSRIFVIVSALACFPQWESVYSGNTSIWFAPLITFFWLTIQARQFLAGLMSSICLIKIQYLPVVFLAGLILGRWKYVLSMATMFALLFVLSGATLGWENLTSYPAALLHGETSATIAGVAVEQMQNLRGEMFLITGSDKDVTHFVSLAALALAILATGYLWLTYKPKNENAQRQFRIRASITSLMLIIFSPHTHKHDYSVCVLPCVWLWQELVISELTGERLRAIAKATIVSFPFLSWVFFFLSPLFQMIFMQPFFVWACLLLTLAVIALKRDNHAAKAHIQAAPLSR